MHMEQKVYDAPMMQSSWAGNDEYKTMILNRIAVLMGKVPRLRIEPSHDEAWSAETLFGTKPQSKAKAAKKAKKVKKVKLGDGEDSGMVIFV
jgi:hypothetical protein